LKKKDGFVTEVVNFTCVSRYSFVNLFGLAITKFRNYNTRQLVTTLVILYADGLKNIDNYFFFKAKDPFQKYALKKNY
jgi:hypothetical protein